MSSLRRPPQRGRPADCFFRSDVGSRGDELFFFNDTATTEIYTLSLHDALPISARPALLHPEGEPARPRARERRRARLQADAGRAPRDRRGVLMLTTWGASKGPPCPPRARTRPGGAVARLEFALRVPGPRRAQALG